MAIHDINSWAVIFCGFIVYIIWGIVFDQCMDAYDKMDLNKTKLKEIAQKIQISARGTAGCVGNSNQSVRNVDGQSNNG